MIEELFPKYREEFAYFDIFIDWLFWKEVWCSFQSVYIDKVCLSHKQSAVECSFGSKKDYIMANLSENCIIFLRIIHKHLIPNKVKVSSITNTADMIKSVRSARDRHDQFRLENSNKKKTIEKALKREMLQTSLKRLRKRRCACSMKHINRPLMQKKTVMRIY